MTDLTKSLLPDLNEDRFPALGLGAGLVTPAYEGGSILNIPSSVAHLMGAAQIGERALRTEIIEPLGTDARRVVLILMDGLALHRFQRWLPRTPAWQRLMDAGVLAPLTSITPSTTSAAITTFWTGTPPAVHGVTGYEMWLKQYGIIANMIEHKPISFGYGNSNGHLSAAGFDPLAFLPVPTIGAHLAQAGINTYAFQHYSLSGSGLSDMFMPGANRRSFGTPAELWVSLRQHLEEMPADEHAYNWVYWSPIDTYSHRYGPDDEHVMREFVHFTQAFEEIFLNELSEKAREDTVVILTADHGHVATRKGDPHYMLENHPNLTKRVHIFAGESRLPFLYIRAGQVEAVRETIERTWPNQFTILESSFALHEGLFGRGPHHEDILNRIGDLMLVPQGDAFLWWHAKPDPLIGRHGGLHTEEMLVPFVAGRLG